MFSKVELVTDHGMVIIGNSRVCGLTTDTVKVNLYQKEGKIGIDVFQLDERAKYKKWDCVFTEWVGNTHDAKGRA